MIPYIILQKLTRASRGPDPSGAKAPISRFRLRHGWSHALQRHATSCL